MNTIAEKNITAVIAASIRQQSTTSIPFRNDALTVFETLGLPNAKHEEYKHTPITRTLEKNFTFSPIRVQPLTGIESFFISNLDAHRIVFVNGVYSKERSTLPSSDVQIESLAAALENKNPLALEHFAKYAQYKNDALAAWNTAGWSDGLFIRIPENFIVAKPIIFHYIVSGNEGEVVAVNRNLIVVGKNSQVTFIEKFDSTGKTNHFTNLVSEIVVQENAGLDLYSIQNDAANRYQHGLTEIYQKNSSRVNTFTFTLQGKFYRNNLHLTLDGEGVESHMYGLYLIDKDTLSDHHTVADHRKPNSFSNELYKGIMDGNSKGVFNGKIFVRPQAQKTNAFQANRNILLTDTATVNTKPQLEIWADDVKCSHGCTTGQLDEEALFYIQSRGIEKETARAMMLYAFAGEVLDQIKNPVLKEFLDSVVSDRLHKNF